MASIGHLAVGLAAARLGGAPERVPTAAWAALLVVLSFLPDADVIAFALGIPYGAPWGHRGIVHSIAFAGLVGAALAGAAAWLRIAPARVGLVAWLVMASHGLLDALTDGGRGIALAWPLSHERYFAPWTPIPVAPIGARILSREGLALMAYEALLFTPVWLAAAWPRRRPAGRRAPDGAP